MENTASIDEQALHALYQQLTRAWNSGDGQAYGAVFTEDASYIDVTGTNTQGRHAISAAHQQMFQTFLKGSQLVATITSIRFLCPDIALLHVQGNTLLAGQTELAPDRATIETAIAVKEQGKWLFTALQNTRIMQMPPRQ
ncbi:MAG TPA: SgcJ/EcaC family oxidoreductase [Ktedonobacteraceae bacterium]|nr:SgcJ/EcaC family oxidoreductase [Ktedonobacteraceae bacterium]